MRTIRFTALIEREDDGFVSLCPELDIASQGNTVEEARAMLKEAVELFFECASEDEIQERLGGECYIVPMECNIA
ncbi:MAG TPA: type II toxin-antitoxin system HicB family antitoxin [Candidatus Hydrogenedentes bacterium]|nr:type II toxin-antitoxin system HicB family antitoxin [Candidatus Hydrogenedentota bacterium]